MEERRKVRLKRAANRLLKRMDVNIAIPPSSAGTAAIPKEMGQAPFPE
jgi:hypothetical protein